MIVMAWEVSGQACPMCDGDGIDPDYTAYDDGSIAVYRCDICNGTGVIAITPVGDDLDDSRKELIVVSDAEVEAYPIDEDPRDNGAAPAFLYDPMPRAEIEKLKADWYRDPCWDIADTEGFEAHREELQAYQDECAAKWRADREAEENVPPLERAQQAARRWGHLWSNAEEGSSSYREMMAAQALATIAMAEAAHAQVAQLKRIADALEAQADGEHLRQSVAIYGA